MCQSVLDLVRPSGSVQRPRASESINSFIHLKFAQKFLQVFPLFFYPFMENQIENVSFSCCLLKQGLDMKNRAGSRGGCPLINLSSPRHTVQPRRPLLIYTLWGNDRQAFGPTASAPCLDAGAAPSGQAQAGLGRGGGLHLRLSREKENQSNKAPFTVQGSDGELWEERTQPYPLRRKAALTLMLTERVTGGLCPPACVFPWSNVCVCVCG